MIGKWTVDLKYLNADGTLCKCTLLEPGKTHHIWYSHKRNCFGKFEAHKVDMLSAFLNSVSKSGELISAHRYLR